MYYAAGLGAACGIPVLLNAAPATPELDLAQLGGLMYLIPNQSELQLLTGEPAAAGCKPASHMRWQRVR